MKTFKSTSAAKGIQCRQNKQKYLAAQICYKEFVVMLIGVALHFPYEYKFLRNTEGPTDGHVYRDGIRLREQMDRRRGEQRWAENWEHL